MVPPDDWGDGLPGIGGPDADGMWGDGIPEAFGETTPTPPTPTPQAGSFIAEILVGNVVVWSALNTLPKRTLSLDVSAFEGIFEIKLRIRGLA